MTQVIKTRPLTAEDFAPFGDVLVAEGETFKTINQGKCRRFHDLAKLDFEDGDAGISLFKSETCSLPHEFDLLERHPLGSQAFIPMSQNPFLVIAASDHDGVPVDPQAFLTAPGQAINLYLGVWHGVLTPLHVPGLFAVFDRIGDGENLEEYTFEHPYLVQEG
jgi:ureidoglycolate lyase